MTGFGDDDLDLLADYIGGALTGTPEADRVADLVADDPRWAAAHAELSAAMASVRADLNEYGASPEPMPAEVWGRLDTVLSGGLDRDMARGLESDAAGAFGDGRKAAGAPGGGASAGGAGDHRAERPGAGDAVGRRLVLVPGEGSGSKVRRRMRWAVPVATAAGVLAFAGFGLGQLRGADSDGAGSSAARPGAAEDRAGGTAEGDMPMAAAASGAVVSEPTASQILASGIDYQPETLTAEDDRLEAGGKPAPAPNRDQRSDELIRLQGYLALRACLEAISADNGGSPITVQTVDYARYLGNPALIVRFVAANGRFVWVSGPDCGTPAAGSDRKDFVRVGS